jgi:hypothetical protein
MLRRGRFDDLVCRQLDLFQVDEASLLAEAEEADAAWTNAPADETEELYGDYQLVVDDLGERLYDVRETYGATLDDRTAADYRDTFNRMATRRFRRLAAFLEDAS